MTLSDTRALVALLPSRATVGTRLGRNRAVATTPLFTSLFVLAHIPLALVLKNVPLLATGHALLALAVGLLFLRRDQGPERVVYVAAYITGCELLWRASHAAVFWEFGKYSVSMLLGLALIRHGLLREASRRPLYAFLFLLPSLTVLTSFDREAIAFNLSGPFSLAVCAMFFSTVKLGPAELRKVLAAIIAPIAGMATLSTVSSLEADLTQLVIGGKATTAGLGPNQVSSVLGLGITAAVLSYFFWPQRRIRQAILLLALWFMIQGILSLSRGGLWTAVGAIAVASFYLLRSREARGRFFLVAAAIWVVSQFFLLPWVDDRTGGIVRARFSSADLTGRDQIMKADVMAFRDHPLLGLGPGESRFYHTRTFRVSATHTEYTRLLAEHGAFGLASLLIYVSLGLKRWRRRDSHLERAVGLACMAWAALFLIHAAMRLVAPAFLFGLGCAGLELTARRPARRGEAASQQLAAPHHATLRFSPGG